MNTRVDVSDVVDLFTAYADRLDLTKGAGEEIAAVLEADALRQFQAGGIPAWQPLSPLTIERKRRLGYPRLNREGLAPVHMIQNGNFGPANILEMTGDLLSSWTNPDDPHHKVDIAEGSVSIGTDIEYAGTHQHGAPGKGFNGSDIPERPIRVTPEAQDSIRDLLFKHMEKDK